MKEWLKTEMAFVDGVKNTRKILWCAEKVRGVIEIASAYAYVAFCPCCGELAFQIS